MVSKPTFSWVRNTMNELSTPKKQIVLLPSWLSFRNLLKTLMAQPVGGRTAFYVSYCYIFMGKLTYRGNIFNSKKN